MKILLTGANGFIGKNLCVKLSEIPDIEIIPFCKGDNIEEVVSITDRIDFVIHLAGANRPVKEEEFQQVNSDLTAQLCSTLKNTPYQPPVIFASSTQVDSINPYGNSKLAAENILKDYSNDTGAGVTVFRLPNVFGKWCLPDYNSVVATFCHNIANDLDINIHNPNTTLTLVYIDDVIEHFLSVIKSPEPKKYAYMEINPSYSVRLGELATAIYNFRDSRNSLITDNVGNGFLRALYATYLSYLKPESFSYPLVSHKDNRGIFVEFLKTTESGQFSFFTAHPGITRGGHYHHTKNEKFLVVQGAASFKFRNISTGQFFEKETSSDLPEVVETIPGWAHDITNTGDNDLIVLLWANEIFDKNNPDTIGASLDE